MMKSFQFEVPQKAVTNANRQRGNRVGICLVSSYSCVRFEIDFRKISMDIKASLVATSLTF